MLIVAIGRQENKLMANAELRQQCVDRPKLHALATAGVPDAGGVNVILTIRDQER